MSDDSIVRFDVGMGGDVCIKCMCRGDLVFLEDDACPACGFRPSPANPADALVITKVDRENGTITVEYDAIAEPGARLLHKGTIR